MKASELLKRIQDNLNDYPIEYLKNKANDDRYPDSITKRLAQYNSGIYDEIYSTELNDDFDIKDSVIEKFTEDIKFYFEEYDTGDEESRNFTENISLYLALIAKKPLHPFSEDKKDEVYCLNSTYYCKNRIKYIRDEKSLCRYCVCKNVGFQQLF